MSIWSWLSAPSDPPPEPTAPPRPSSAASPNLVHSTQGGGGATDKEAETGVEAQTALASWQALLEPFKEGVLPEKARTDPTVKQLQAKPMTVLGLWQYVPFVAKQSTSLTKAFVQHHLFGPPKPSWGVELTLFTTFLREVSSYSHLSSLTRLRSVLALGSLLPTPKDGIVTPISFRVKRRNLRGILAEFDELETGEREISGEWVTNKRLWKRMTREWMTNKGSGANGTAAGGGGGGGEAKAQTGPGENGKKEGGDKNGMVCLYLHGGAFYMFSAETHRYLTISVSRYCEARVFAINYRLAPETRFPGQLHDAVSAYMRLTVDLKIPPENIIFAGDSAGGGLCLATLMYLRDEGYPLPAGAILMSPWVDLTMSCASWETNRPYDYLPNPNSEDDHLHPVKCLLDESMIEKYITHPYVSPLFGDFTGLPPLLIQAGDAEVLRDEITLVSHKAAMAGVKVEHEIFEDCVHVFQAFLFLEASRKAFQSQRTYVKHTLPRLRRKLAAATKSSSPSSAVPAGTSLPSSYAPSPAPSSDVSPESEFDFAEVDQEVVSDAHKVGTDGKAEEESLPPTPTMGIGGGRALESEDEEMELEEDDEDEDERLSDSTLSPAELSPVPQADTPTRGEFPGFVAPPPPSAAAPPPPPPPSLSSRRPSLRAYSSARDLSMSATSPSSTSTSSSSPTSTRKHRSSTLSASTPLTSTSNPSSPRFSARPLAPDQYPRSALHARTASYPEFEVLLREYMAGAGVGDGEKAKGGSVKGRPRATTRVWGQGAGVRGVEGEQKE